MDKAIIVIPARLGASRFRGKPLEPILGKPMILHCWETAKAANIGEVIVACGDAEIYDCVREHGGIAVLTDANLPSGSDRIYAALCAYDPDEQYGTIINMQGDLPHLPQGALEICLRLLRQERDYDMASLAAPMSAEAAEVSNSDIVKIIMTPSEKNGLMYGRAYGFSRCAVPHGEGERYHHIGIYGFRREALRKFVSLPPSPLERRERLEQWRALENDMRIAVALIDEVPVSVDVPEDIAKAEAYINGSR